MNNIFTRTIILLFSAIIALGAFIGVAFNNFGSDNYIIGMLSIMIILNQFFSSIIFNNIKHYGRFLLPLVLYWAITTINDIKYSFSSDSIIEIINLKLLILILLLIALYDAFKRDSILLHYSLAVFSFFTVALCLVINLELVENLIEVSKGRLIFAGENPNSISTRFALSGIYIFYLIYHNPFKLKYIRIFLFFFLINIILAILKTGSQGSLLAIIICILILLILPNNKLNNNRFIFLFIFISTIALTIYYMLSTDFDIVNRLVNTYQVGNIGSRKVVWEDALYIFFDYPLFGIGNNGYFIEMNHRYGYFLDSHNIFIHILVTSGFFGFISFIIFLWKIFIVAQKKNRMKNNLPIVFFLFVLIISYKTGDIINYTIMWYIISLIISFDDKKNPEITSLTIKSPNNE